MTNNVKHDWKDGGSLKGKQWQPREIAAELYKAGFTDADELFTMLAVVLSESQGYDRAFNDNVNTAGMVTSRDVGIAQINIPASAIGTNAETELYDVPTNLKRARQLFTSLGANGQARRFTPWVGFTSHVCNRDTYLKRAARGVANFWAAEALTRDTDTLSGSAYVHTLTNPMTDYEYRVTEQHNAITKALTEAKGRRTTFDGAQESRHNIVTILSAAVNIPKE